MEILAVVAVIILFGIYAALRAPQKANAKAEAKAKADAIHQRTALKKRLQAEAKASIIEQQKAAAEARTTGAWRTVLPGREAEFIDQTLQALYAAGVGTVPKIRRPNEYIAEIDEAYALHKTSSQAPFDLVEVILNIVALDNAQSRNVEATIVKVLDAKRATNTAFGLPAITTVVKQPNAEVHDADALVNAPANYASTYEEQSQIVRLALEAVYGMGASWIPKTRSVQEYLREVEARWLAMSEATRMPIKLSHAVLDIIRDDCSTHPKVLMAVDRAKNSPLPDALVQF